MKRNIVTIAFLAATMLAHAEVDHNIGIQIGWDREIERLNQPSMFNSDKNDLQTYPLNGGQFGLIYELNHESGVSLFTALNYSYTWNRSAWEKIPYTREGKPAKVEWSKLEYSRYTQAHTLDVDLHFQYKFEVAAQTYLVFHTGPSFQYVAYYKAQDNFRYNDQEEDLRYYFKDNMQYNAAQMANYYKRWNVAWGLGAAFQYDMYFIRGGYNFGLVNPYKIQCFGEPLYEDGKPVFPNPDNDHYPDDRLTRGRLDNWYVTLGVFFWQSDK